MEENKNFIPEIYIGENGNWFINNYDTGVKARGDDGITPHIGANGNWFLGDTDTGVAATGPKGDKGDPGPAGPKGDKGEQGPAGPVHIANNLITDTEGFALDARQGRELNEELQAISGRVNSGVLNIGSYLKPSNDILAEALNTEYMFSLISSGEFTTNVPNTYYRYTLGIVLRRKSDQITVILFGRDNGLATNRWDGTSWSGWKIR